MPDLASPLAVPPSPATPPTGPSPVGAPSQPGLNAAARAKMSAGVQALIEALGILKDVSTDEGKALVDALRILGKVIPDAAEGLSQTAMMGMQSAAPATQAAQPPRVPGLIPPPRPTIMAGPRQMPSMR